MIKYKETTLDITKWFEEEEREQDILTEFNFGER